MAAAKKAPPAPAAKKTAAKTAAAPPAPPAKAAKPAKEPAPKREKIEANGVTRPAPGTKTGIVWEQADAITAKNKGVWAERAAVFAAAQAKGVNDATIATQYQLWRKFNNVPKREAAPKPPKEAKPAKAAKAAPAPPPAKAKGGKAAAAAAG